MNFARTLIRDLVAKRLWPIALLLVVALVAVPVVMSRGGDEPVAPDPVTLGAVVAGDEADTVSAIDLVGPPSVRSRSGKVRNPFRRPAVKAAGAEATPSDPAADGAKTGATGGAPAETTPTPATPAEPVVKPTYYRTEVRFYEATEGKPRPLSRLEPLGGLVDTAALYLGVTRSSDGLYGVFLLGPGATSDGEAKCEDDTCRVIGLKSGQSQLVTVQPADGSEARQYVLEAVAVRAVTSDAASARSMRIKVHPDGRDVMRSMWEDGPTAAALGPVQYDYDTGLLVKSGADATAAKASK